MSTAAVMPSLQHQDWTKSGERQVADSLRDIRGDHIARYRFANRQLQGLGTDSPRVIDIACGVGYGSWMMASANMRVLAIDSFLPAIEYAKQHWNDRRITYLCASAQEVVLPGEYDAAVCFETIEHLPDGDALVLLKKLRRSTRVLLASVPNEDELPYGCGFDYHFRHYTRQQFEALLNAAGWIVQRWFGQLDERSPVTGGVGGRTLIASCVHTEEDDSEVLQPDNCSAAPDNCSAAPDNCSAAPDNCSAAPDNCSAAPDQSAYDCMVAEFPVPEHVAILGLGPSLEQYVDITKRLGGKHAYCNEVWGINAVAGTLLCDRVFHMDDVRIQEIRAAAQPESNIARMLQWMRVHPGPIITSREHPDYPGLVAFPLEEVVNSLGQAYFNSTAAYAVAYAIHLGVKHISIFGCDYTYPDSHDAEKGRGCLEFWLGIASARGIKLSVPKTSTLLDGIYTQQEHFYGYDTLAVTLRPRESGGVTVGLDPIVQLPSAEDIENRYDHSQHPNKLVSG